MEGQIAAQRAEANKLGRDDQRLSRLITDLDAAIAKQIEEARKAEGARREAEEARKAEARRAAEEARKRAEAERRAEEARKKADADRKVAADTARRERDARDARDAARPASRLKRPPARTAAPSPWPTRTPPACARPISGSRA